MTTEPARPPFTVVPEPTPPRTPAELFGKRMFQFADLLISPDIDKQKFGSLMQAVAEGFGELSEAEFYHRVKEATDLLPMTRAQAQTFAVKIRGHLKTELGEQ